MANKHKLTEELKVLETKVYEARVDMIGLNRKLNAAYAYETELLERIAQGRKHIAVMQEELRTKHTGITELFNEMSNKMDIFTGNFYKSNV